jgi:hypothetical protein
MLLALSETLASVLDGHSSSAPLLARGNHYRGICFSFKCGDCFLESGFKLLSASIELYTFDAQFWLRHFPWLESKHLLE